MIASIKAGFRHTIRHWKLAVYIFIVQFIVAAIVGFLFEKDLSAELGQSISGRLFNDRFNYTVFKDMLRDAPEAISSFLSGLQFVVLLFFVIAIFLQAGAISSLIQSQSSIKDYVKNAIKYFLPFFGLALIFLFLFLMITGILWVPLLMNALPIVEALESDKIFIWILGGVFILYLLLISFLINWSINARINYAIVKKSIWSSVKSGFKWTKEKYLSLLLPFLLFLCLGIFMMYLNVKFDNLNAIFLVFAVSLFLSLIRIFIRLWYYSSLSRFSSAIN